MLKGADSTFLCIVIEYKWMHEQHLSVRTLCRCTRFMFHTCVCEISLCAEEHLETLLIFDLLIFVPACSASFLLFSLGLFVFVSGS